MNSENPSMAEEQAVPETHPFKMDHLPVFFREKAARELKESSEVIALRLRDLRTMAQGHKVTRDIEFVDDFLLQFLRNRKFNVQRALKQLSNFVSLRNSHGFMFSRLDLDQYFKYPSGIFFTTLPRRCPDGCTLLLFEFGKWDPDVLPVQDFKTLLTTMLCQAIRDPMTQINGFKIIYDFTDTSLKHMKCFTPSNVYLFYHGVLDCLPGRHKQMLLIENSIVAKIAYAFFKTIATQKIRDRIVMNSFREYLLEYLPASVLPTHYGGDLTDYFMKDWIEEANEQQGKLPYAGQCNYY